jgi:phosphate starvation-inducible protein PhoH
VVRFSKDDVVRHKLVQSIVEAYRVHEEGDNPWGEPT